MEFSPAQLGYAKTILSVGDRAGATMADKKTALVVALDESDLQMYANSKVPASLKLPHDNVGSDGMSVGLFQQQVGMWGDAATLMNTEASALLFFHAIANVKGREAMPIPKVAQAVQGSATADGSNYAARMGQAGELLLALGASDTGAVGGNGTAAATPAGSWLSQHGGWQRVGFFALGITILIFAVVYMLGTDTTVQAMGKTAAEVVAL